MNIGILGSGYVGTVTGAGLAELGNDVIFVDFDAAKVQAGLPESRRADFE